MHAGLRLKQRSLPHESQCVNFNRPGDVTTNSNGCCFPPYLPKSSSRTNNPPRLQLLWEELRTQDKIQSPIHRNNCSPKRMKCASIARATSHVSRRGRGSQPPHYSPSSRGLGSRTADQIPTTLGQRMSKLNGCLGGPPRYTNCDGAGEERG